jgi:SAM-dependent methyltransferase
MSDRNGNGKPAAPRVVVLGMPGYGELTGGAARGFWRASQSPGLRVDRHYAEGSLLANNFNQLWCEALNLARSGGGCDYFAMQHADVEPQDWWLDTLIAELDATGLDVLGAVVPIKDQRGITSLALQGGEREPWSPLCRLTMSDCYRLPPTFTSDDIGRPLLLNTGLWVCRFDEAWAKKVWFEINDRIKFHGPTGRYQAVNESEDWFFSRLCHEIGLKVGATRKVALTHRGPSAFPNTQAWGDPWDRASQAASPLPDVAPSGRFLMPAIDGWLRYEEGAALAEMARGKRVLEVGSYRGLSTVCIARTADYIVSVDTHDGRGTAIPQGTLAALKANLKRYEVADRVAVHRMTLGRFSESWIKVVDPVLFDLVFIDGDHSRDAVESDIRHALPLLAPGGLIAFHDYCNHADPGVAEAVDALIGRGGELVSLVESLAVVRPPALVPQPLEV